MKQNSQKQTLKQKLILIGSGMVGVKFLEELLEEAPDQFEIRVFNKEPAPGYNRIMLSPVLAGEMTAADIITHDYQWFEEHEIKFHSGTSIISVDTESKTVTTDLGGSYEYDRLIVATGSNPFMPPIPGSELSGVISFRDMRDVKLMSEVAKTKHNAVVIGGGLLGLEAANGLMKLGMNVTVIHRRDILMNVQMDQESGRLLKESLVTEGMHFLMPAEAKRFMGTDSVEAIELQDGSVIKADLVVMAVGIRPNIQLAQKIGLDCHHGILVNDQLQTNLTHIYALGECVEHRGQLYGLVAPLYEQASVLTKVLAGKESAYLGSAVSTKLKVTGINLFSAGDFHDSDDSESLIYQDQANHIYRKVVLQDSKIKGAVMFGDVSSANWIFDQMVEKTDVSAYRDTLVFGEGFAPSKQQ